MRTLYQTAIVKEQDIAPKVTAMVSGGWDFVQLVLAAPGKYVILFRRNASS
jgi:hypothetical protein